LHVSTQEYYSFHGSYQEVIHSDCQPGLLVFSASGINRSAGFAMQEMDDPIIGGPVMKASRQENSDKLS
jgi:hypothetical protein